MNIIDKILNKTTNSRFRIGNFNIHISRGHSLPFVLQKYPDYGSNLVRLARTVNDKYDGLKIIDVGGNVGDTIAMLLSDNPDYEIYSVEGDKKYYNILCENFANNKSVRIYKNFLGDKDEIIQALADRNKGTLRLEHISTNKNFEEIKLITLDTFILENPSVAHSKLVKIDTDGYDNKIIRGAKNYFKKNKPVIYFEYDKKLLGENGEDSLKVFEFLKDIGYSSLVFFDNYGRFLISVNVDNIETIKQLDHYVTNQAGSFAYYDIVAFAAEDSDISRSFIDNELQRK
jgi:FkbM family methyltransferase